MSIKDQLLSEAKNITLGVELDSIFESVELAPEVKAKFSTVFESVVKQHAVTLAESHVAQIAEEADRLVEEKSAEKVEQLSEQVNKYFDHLVETWMEENKIAVDNGIKVQMFESLLGSMKAVFVEHNVSVPEESVDVVAEMEEELREARNELNGALDKVSELKESIVTIKRDQVVAEATKDLTEIQKGKVMSLSEGIAFGDTFADKLTAIVEMVSAVKPQEQPAAQIDENLNFVEQETNVEPIVENKQPTAPQIDPAVAGYLNFI
ncbi:gp22 prohead core scaffold protein [Aeromonas phage Aeh1]|uniref:Gp22 prohead core scaffold protein n=1 Tax=Aeromonas phage Aeh1 TaxID=2880362 RepID=Q76YL1_9CAUD|nr:head scaffolding protein [Aeromonas phage Aeh1]AAQ17885.1 gp22 prohead core scaffold protein [Aeromonas phage Aeh1]